MYCIFIYFYFLFFNLSSINVSGGGVFDVGLFSVCVAGGVLCLVDGSVLADFVVPSSLA